VWNIPSRERLDRLPRLHATESTPLHNKLVYLHFLIGDSDWYVCEFDGDDLFFSYAILNGDMDNAEWGYISLGRYKIFQLMASRLTVSVKVYVRQSPYLKYPE
jgi:hypothetical protein